MKPIESIGFTLTIEELRDIADIFDDGRRRTIWRDFDGCMTQVVVDRVQPERVMFRVRNYGVNDRRGP